MDKFYLRNHKVISLNSKWRIIYKIMHSANWVVSIQKLLKLNKILIDVILMKIIFNY
jgi:hypothetical protein